MSNLVPVSTGVGAITALNPYVACTAILITGLIVIKAMDSGYIVRVKHGDTAVELAPAGRNK